MTRKTIILWQAAAFLVIAFLLFPGRLAEPPAHTFLDDASEYNATALSLLQHGVYSLDGVTPSSEREPGYSLFLTGVYALAGPENRGALFLCQILLHVLAGLIFLWALGKTVGQTTATLGGFFLFFSPSVFHLVLFAYRESVALSLFLLVLAGILTWMRRPRWGTILSTAGASGLLSVTYLPMLPVLALLFLGTFVRRKFLMTATTLLIFIIPLTLWGTRNLMYPTTRDCLLGGCVRSAAAWYTRARQIQDFSPLDPARCLWVEFITRKFDALPPACDFRVVKDSHLSDATSREIARQSLTVVFSHLPKHLWISTFWVFMYHLPYVNGWGFFYNVLEALATVLLYLGMIAAILGRPLPRVQILFWMCVIVGTAIFALIDVEPRYRMPFLGAYAALAGMGYAAAWEWLRKRRMLQSVDV